MDVMELAKQSVSSVQKNDEASACQQQTRLHCHRQLGQQLVQTHEALAEGSCDCRQFAVLYVDDEEKSLKCFSREYGKTFRILTATNAQDAVRIVKEPRNQVGLVLANGRMPGRNGRWLLEKVRQIQPRVVRMLVSTFPSCSDLCAATAAANAGKIYGVIIEPWDPAQLEHVLRRALEYFLLLSQLDRVARSLVGDDL